ncbi:hypothetical protein Kpol_460p11 [Vanderwaltozyma polyspora DSM 70294]|uniref:ER membrane protein complex subunit 4 n=1 Tax=Vanderwaltozyma polyspora (strain ATCC 22028 / DSM 70294 / BCRC 21397 / CBS 2163 / NBRC 10782 / NRRL Y-8283 / UCD 57-17) TaxID=436907 RepID=A7TQS7_VANPO|nr:uncharacterized protein Kpol_460p11 [Vanderwaltozyma polyspora DSM 70294]EDO15376.1 hypothetical protein Kpol_460p11 [Vanderwaltozyma polyspora DSM 70294]
MRMDEPYEWATNLVDSGYIQNLPVESSNTLSAPIGFKVVGRGKGEESGSNSSNGVDDAQLVEFQMQKAWQIATQPAKSLPMNFFMSYMSGTSLQIIPIMTALMLLSGPIKAIFSVNKVFQPILNNGNRGVTSKDILGPMAMFVVFQFALMGIGIHKLNSMGLFPTTESDWLSWKSPLNVTDSVKAFAF